MGIFKRNKKSSLDTNVPKIVVGKRLGASESYYRLKDNILYYSDNGKNKVFYCESSVAGEGKSTVVINLAVALAKSGKKVVLLDLDFRRPKIHRAFIIVNLEGITVYMLGECDKSSLIKKTDFGVDVINRGKAAQNASIIFTSNKFKNLIEELKAEYDIVLFDCPPVLMVSDYIHIAKLSDAAIFIVRLGVTHRSNLKESIELLKRNNINVLGTVITYDNMNKFNLKYGRYYSGKYYRYLYNNYLSEND